MTGYFQPNEYCPVYLSLIVHTVLLMGLAGVQQASAIASQSQLFTKQTPLVISSPSYEEGTTQCSRLYNPVPLG